MTRVALALQQATRFWSKVEKTTDCWLWTRAVDKDGYGKFQITTHSTPKQIHVRAHRIAYEMTHGELGPDVVLMHSCDNPRCVNPAHLTPGTQAENRADCGRKDRNAKGNRNGAHKRGSWVSGEGWYVKSRALVLEFNGKTQSPPQWSKEIGVPVRIIRQRLRAGWSVERTLTENWKKRG